MIAEGRVHEMQVVLERVEGEKRELEGHIDELKGQIAELESQTT